MKNSSILSLMILFLSFAVSCRNEKKKDHHKFSMVPGILGCEENYKKLEISYESEIVIHGSYFKKEPTDSELESFFIEQTKFLFGTFHDGIPNKNYNFFISNDKPIFEIKKKDISHYGADINIDKLDSPRLSDYLKHFYENKINPKKMDRSYKVNFYTHVNVHFCGNLVPFELSLTFPRDPYLAYWSVDSQDRRLMKNAHLSNVINPCAHDEFIEIKSPTFFWYSWFPNRRSYDAKNKIFNCKSLLKNTLITSAKVKRIPIQQKSIDFFWKKKNDLVLSVVFGRMNNSPNGIKRVKEVFQKLIASNTDTWSQYKSEVFEVGDLGLISFVSFMEEMKEKYKVHFTFEKEREIYQAIIEKEDKRIKFNVFFGGTDLEWELNPQYLSSLLYFFENSDLFFYFGHSGMGQNFEFKRIASGLKISEEELVRRIRTKKDVFYAFMGCYSASYIGREILDARKNLNTGFALSGVRHFVTDFPQLFLENMFSNYSDQEFKYPYNWRGIIYIYFE